MKEAMIYEIKESQNKQSKSNQLNKMIMVINKEKNYIYMYDEDRDNIIDNKDNI